MSLDAKKKRSLAFAVIALVAVAGIAWTFSSTGNSTNPSPVDPRLADYPTDDEALDSTDVAVRSAPQGRSGRSRLEGAPAIEADQDDDTVAGVEKKTKRAKKRKRRRPKKQQDEEEEAKSSSSKAPHPPYGK